MTAPQDSAAAEDDDVQGHLASRLVSLPWVMHWPSESDDGEEAGDHGQTEDPQTP
jgi:hypothetical protein